MDSIMVHPGSVDEKDLPIEPGDVRGEIGKRGGPPDPPVGTIVVDDVGAAAKVEEQNGRRVIQLRQELPGSVGGTAYFKDPEGNIVGPYQVPRRA
jgi:uncharacterized protein